jgi:undecaprenyl-diphosphatase
MPLAQAIVLGIVQGLTEFLPISSSAHQIVAQGFGISIGSDPGLSKNRNLLWLMAAATIPGAIFGVLFEKQAEHAFRSPYVVATTSIVFGLILWLADATGRRQKDIAHISALDAILIGSAQALAIIPGVSRSGSTITAGLFCNLDRTTAARFSFLLSTPIIAGAAAKKFFDIHKAGGIPADMQTAFIAGIVTSAIVGGLTIAFFLNFLRRRSLSAFVWYRILFGIIVIALALFRASGK